MKVLVFGTFDHLHPGHRFVLEEAQKRGEVTVIVARDANVLRIKGHKPDQTEEERRAAIEAAYPMTDAVLGHSDDFLVPVRRYHPDLIVLGYDQRFPPGVRESDLPCAIERLPAFHPEKFKSSRMREPKSGMAYNRKKAYNKGNSHTHS